MNICLKGLRAYQAGRVPSYATSPPSGPLEGTCFINPNFFGKEINSAKRGCSRLKQSRRGVSASIVLVVIVLIVAAAFYIEIPMVSSSSTTSTSGSAASSSTSSTSTATPSGPIGTLTMKIQQPLIVAPDASETVTLSFVAIGEVSGNYSLSASALPSGVTASFKPSSINLPAQISSSVTITLSAASGATIVNSTVSVKATAGPSVFSQPFTLMSVQTLVLIQGNAFAPNSLSVASGTKVYWLNLDPSSSPDLGPDMHDVTAVDNSFSSGTGSLGQYAIYGHTFATAGTVKYESAAQPSMTGQVIVTG
jgi:plastocyanin